MIRIVESKLYNCLQVSLIFLVAACDRIDAREPISEELAGILRSGYDLNGDGRNDVTYEYEVASLPGYFELVDRNFDGRVDATTFFSDSHEPVYGRSDDNGDGFMNVLREYENSTVKRILIDSDHNGIIDTIVTFRFGVVEMAEKFIAPESAGGRPKIGKVKFVSMYPQQETRYETSGDESQFEQNANPIVPLR